MVVDVKVQNVTISFPYKPYGCQLSMMSRVIEALETKQHCLLESPTGTGKTLSLLCSTLAWLNKQIGKPLKLFTRQDSSVTKASSAADTQDDLTTGDQDNDLLLTELEKDQFAEIPKIYYCTRTHKQLTQIIRELRKTSYKHSSMTILSSRQHSCINPQILQSSNITDACQNLLTTGVCPYDQPRKKKDLAKVINRLDRSGPWDLEDLVQGLSEVPSCPYFCARKLAKTAKIIFCPYNYLIDPNSRSAIGIDLTNNIVIIDEAHNIEDASREAASFKITEHQLIKAKEDLDTLSKADVEVAACTALIDMVEKMLRVMQLTLSRLVRAGESAQPTQVWSGQEIAGIMNTVGLGPQKLKDLTQFFGKLSAISSEMAAEERFSSNESQPKAPSGTLRLLNALFTVLHFMFRDNMSKLADYRLVLVETFVYERQFSDQSVTDDLDTSNSWFSKRRVKSRYVDSRELSLNFWCLNPSVIFSDLASQVHCLILTSGTLSPLDALEAELGVSFPIRLEASHVISKDQLMVASLSHGPNGTRLCANYQNQSTYMFQDELGSVILSACRIVPDGVLCFLSSYSLLGKLIDRWETTGLLSQLRSVKHIMIEPQSSSELNHWLQEFYAAVDRTRSDRGNKPCSNEHQSGAVGFAVCRGKVSEGLDFADSYARLIISVGIPYPAFKNPQVQEKRNYNDFLHKLMETIPSHLISNQTSSASKSETTLTGLCSKRVLTGPEWYDAQAYRALNQALGRCIRHRNDWGAVLLVDARFVEQPARYMCGISRWLRTRAVHHQRWATLEFDLKEFIASHEKLAQVEKEVTELSDIFDD